MCVDNNQWIDTAVPEQISIKEEDVWNNLGLSIFLNEA